MSLRISLTLRQIELIYGLSRDTGATFAAVVRLLVDEALKARGLNSTPLADEAIPVLEKIAALARNGKYPTGRTDLEF
jgi:hypothetical protein